ncbi:MAG: hypothetical protein ACLFUS_08870 [Candidatus Sumerlaeia bacterium]
MEAILTLENEFLQFKTFDDCSADIVDKQTGQRWHMGPVAWQDIHEIIEDVVWTRNPRYWCDYFIGRFKAEKQGDHLLISVKRPPHRDDDIVGRFRVEWSLEGADLKLRIFDIDESLPSLNFPPHIESDSLVLPNEVGQWVRNAETSMTCKFITQNNGLNMRWFGGLAEGDQNGWMVICEENYVYMGAYQNGVNINPTYLKSKSEWLDSRSIRYSFTGNGYVGLAKRFRQYALDNKLFRRLDEKIADTPALERLLGGRVISFFQSSTERSRNKENFLQPLTQEERDAADRLEVKIPHADVLKIMEMAKSWGMKKGLFNLRGSFPGGYDDQHPDVWPPEPALGSIDELKQALQQPEPYLAALHDNYQDIYEQSPSFPHGVIRTRDGHLMHGGYWHGGQCYIICTKHQRPYAERNWEKLKTLGMTAHFVDTMSCVRFYECHDPDHPMVMEECRQNKLKLMQFFKEQNIVLGSEEAADFGMYYIDWLENRHMHTPHESIPLWPLVFHDAAFYTRYSTAGTSGGEPVDMLSNLLWGYMPYWPANDLASWPSQEAAFKASLDCDKWHGRVGMDDMTNHEYLDDGLVERTEFSSGVSMVANYSDEAREFNGKQIAPKGHLIVE